MGCDEDDPGPRDRPLEVHEARGQRRAARLAKALGHRSRVRIVGCLASGRCRSCGELVTLEEPTDQVAHLAPTALLDSLKGDKQFIRKRSESSAFCKSILKSFADSKRRRAASAAGKLMHLRQKSHLCKWFQLLASSKKAGLSNRRITRKVRDIALKGFCE